MVDYIIPQKEVLDLYRKQKSEFNFHQRSDDEFIVFLLDTASRVLSIAHQLTPVIEAVSYESEGQATETLDAETAEDSESQEESISKSTEAEPDPSSFQSLPELQPCKPETLSSQEDAIFQLAKEIESVANTLLDEQKSSAILSSELNNSSLPMETENLITDSLSNQNISPSVKLSNDQNFKPSVTALPYSMLDMSNIQLDTSVSATMANSENLLNSISLLPGSKRSLSSKPTERLKELKTMYDVSPFNGKAQCRICRREFTESANCRRHIETIHFNVRHFQCHLCDKNFHTNWVLQTHFKKKHNM
ncbi:MDS1 and EVI1 complex locus protein EVI1-B-like isoform X2 [Bolinopsis microptera]|uniref:MDS1 and EVI1 complex locus protein EVI1-B-like isoform X2 n=1 Tax=Bolinopsis microptera TaxID=2820187 RepID=UPI00307A49A1